MDLQEATQYQVYDGVSWSMGPHALTARRGFPGALVMDDTLYLLGGSGFASGNNAIDKYDGTTWTTDSVSLPRARWMGAWVIYDSSA